MDIRVTFERLLLEALLRDVPFVDDDDEALAGLQHVAREHLVLLGHALQRIEHEEYHVALFNGFTRAVLRKEFDRRFDTRPGAQARGVKDRERPRRSAAGCGKVEIDLDGVARGAGRFVHNQAFVAQQRVAERRLADVGPADEGELDAFHGGGVRGFLHRWQAENL